MRERFPAIRSRSFHSPSQFSPPLSHATTASIRSRPPIQNCFEAVPDFVLHVVTTQHSAPNNSAMHSHTSGSVNYSCVVRTVLSAIALQRAENENDNIGDDNNDDHLSSAYLRVKSLIAHARFNHDFDDFVAPVIDDSAHVDANGNRNADFSLLQRTFLYVLDANAGRANERYN